MRVTKINTRCWNCGRECQYCSSVEEPDRVPGNGDVHFCVKCGALALFDDTNPDGIRKPSPSERDEMMRTEHIIKMVLFWERALNDSKRNS